MARAKVRRHAPGVPLDKTEFAKRLHGASFDGVMIVTPVRWYQAPTASAAMIDLTGRALRDKARPQ